jgi:hypothetical protein
MCDNQFIGPINNHLNDSIFFVSITEPDIINIKDFSYKDDKEFPKIGRIKQLKIVEIFSFLHENNIISREIKLGDIIWQEV